MMELLSSQYVKLATEGTSSTLLYRKLVDNATSSPPEASCHRLHAKLWMVHFLVQILTLHPAPLLNFMRVLKGLLKGLIGINKD